MGWQAAPGNHSAAQCLKCVWFQGHPGGRREGQGAVHFMALFASPALTGPACSSQSSPLPTRAFRPGDTLLCALCCRQQRRPPSGRPRRRQSAQQPRRRASELPGGTGLGWGGGPCSRVPAWGLAPRLGAMQPALRQGLSLRACQPESNSAPCELHIPRWAQGGGGCCAR